MSRTDPKTDVVAMSWTVPKRLRRIVFQAGDEHGYSITRADDVLIIIIEDNYSQLI